MTAAPEFAESLEFSLDGANAGEEVRDDGHLQVFDGVMVPGVSQVSPQLVTLSFR
jgi:hypothetical protein